MTKIRKKSGKSGSSTKLKRVVKNLSIIDLILICFFSWKYKGQKKVDTVDFLFHEYVKWVRNSEDWYKEIIALIRAVKKCKTMAEVKKLKVPSSLRPKVASILNKCRTPKAIYDALKRKCAVQVYPSCTFDKKGCTRANAKNVTGIMVFDLQDISQEAVKRIKKWCHTVALHNSIGGGDGDYALFVHCSGLTVDNYKGMWENVNQLIQRKFDISPDSSDHTNELNRVRYLSYDPEIYYNAHAKSIKDTIVTFSKTPEATPPQIINYTSEDVQKLVGKIERKKIDIMPDYETFLKMGFAFASLGEGGLDYYIRLSKFYKGEQKRSPEEQFTICQNSKLPKGSKPITLATFFKIAGDYGFKLPETRRKQLRRELRKLQQDADGTTEWIRKHVYLIRSVKASNKFAHVLVDEANICYYFEGDGNSPSEPLLQKIASLLNLPPGEWPEFKNKQLTLFDETWIQKDTTDTIYLYFLNGTFKITKDKAEFIPGNNRPMIWDDLVIKENYKPTNKIHPIARLAEKCVVDYEKLQIGLGYLLHRWWFRNAAKIVVAVDHKPASRHDGRRGKDLFTTFVQLMRKFVSLKWKPGHNFWTSSIKPDTAIGHFEDTPNYMFTDTEIIKAITGDLQVEPKGENILIRKFFDKPKMSASCQQYPQDYTNVSIRGRIWLIEFNDYLQKHPPEKDLVYDDKDKSPFYNWMIQCAQVYLSNINKMKGIPELTEDQKTEALKSTYGNTIMRAVDSVRLKLRANKFCPTDEIVDYLDCQPTDNKTIARFRECFEKVTGGFLVKVRRGDKDNRIYGYEAKGLE